MGSRIALAVLLLALPAQAVVVRGRVLDPLGRPLPGARVQLIRGPSSLADTITGVDGTFEIRSSASGRFLLLTSSSVRAIYPAVQIGTPFYAGRADIVEQNVFLDPSYVSPQVSSQISLTAMPLPQLAAIPSQIAADALLTAAQPLFALRQLPSSFIAEQGTTGTQADLYLRGAGPETLKVQIAGAPAEDLGGGFNLATLSTTGLAGNDPAVTLELTPGALPLTGLDAESGLLSVGTSAARESRPSLTLVGDAGNLSTFRGEGDGEITRRRADLRGGFSRFDTDSGAPGLGFHLASADLNAGYNISAGTSLRLLARRDVSGAPLALPLEIFRPQPTGEDSAQNLYSSLTFHTVTLRGWRNRVSLRDVRKRRQIRVYALPAQTLPITLRDARGEMVSAIPDLPLLPAREDLVTNRDQATYDTSYSVTQNHTLLASASYTDERAADLLPGLSARFGGTHFFIAAGASGNLFSGRLHHRLFYEMSGAVDHSSALGVLGAPRVGLTLVPVFPGTHRFRGTTLHATAAGGFGEPGIRSLVFTQAAGASSPAPRSRTFSLGADQVILPQKLTFAFTYFHGQYAHQEELLAVRSVSPTLAYSAQGLEISAHYQPFPRVTLTGGYTYLASLVEQTAERPALNPALPNQPIGALGALAGSRPFNRPPNTGWLAAQYVGSRLSVGIDGSFAGRSDGTSGLPQTPALLLPNRNLSPAYADLNANAMYRIGRHIVVYSQLDNLLNERHIAPFGFLSTPFLIRTGLRLRLGGD
jgi:vitamin B12 transporter